MFFLKDFVSVLNDIVKRLDALSVDFETVRDTIDSVKTQLDDVSTRQNDMTDFIARTDNNFANIIERIERQPAPAPPPVPANQANFTPEMIVEAREQLGVDLSVELVIFF